MCQLAALPYLDVQLDIDILVHWHIGILAHWHIIFCKCTKFVSLVQSNLLDCAIFAIMKLITSQIIQVL